MDSGPPKAGGWPSGIEGDSQAVNVRNRRELNVVSKVPNCGDRFNIEVHTAVYVFERLMIKVLINSIVIALISSVLLACATPDERDEEDFSEPAVTRSDCISDASVRDYQTLDGRNLIVTAAGRRKYHLVLSHSSNELEHARSIGFVSTTGRICSGFGEILLDPGYGVSSGFGPEKIRIRSIVLLSPEEEDILLIHFGLKDPEFEYSRTPEDVAGAGIEELD